MAKDLTTSNVHKKNILNNKDALQEIEQEVALPSILFEGSLRYTKRQIAQFFDIDERTINRYLEQHEAEFTGNGYEVLSGKRLREFKEAYEQYTNDLPDVKDMNVPNMPYGSDIDAVNISKAPKVGVFYFCLFLNIGCSRQPNRQRPSI
tara:strand:- start:2051 stop:2497 length:447 start_codon:yes stop_codon:yes gene_type:complete